MARQHKRTDPSIVQILAGLDYFNGKGQVPYRDIRNQFEWSAETINAAIRFAIADRIIKRVRDGYYEWIPWEDRNPDWPIHEKIRRLEEAEALQKGA